MKPNQHSYPRLPLISKDLKSLNSVEEFLLAPKDVFYHDYVERYICSKKNLDSEKTEVEQAPVVDIRLPIHSVNWRNNRYRKLDQLVRILGENRKKQAASTTIQPPPPISAPIPPPPPPQPPPPHTSDGDTIEEVGNVDSELILPPPPVSFASKPTPQTFSSLNRDEHKQFQSLHKKYNEHLRQKKKWTSGQSKVYNVLLRRVLTEQNEFHKIQRKRLFDYRDIYLHLDERISKQLREYWKIKSKDIPNGGRYELIESVSLPKPNQIFPSRPFKISNSCLLRIGSCRKFFRLENGYEMNISEPVFSTDEESPFPYRRNIETTRVSNDPHIQDFLLQYERNVTSKKPTDNQQPQTSYKSYFQVVTSLPTLVKILSTEKSSQFDIPVTVKTKTIENQETNETIRLNIAYLDSSTPNQTYSPYQSNQKFFKNCMLSHSLGDDKTRIHFSRGKENDESISSLENDNSNYCVWSFGGEMDILLRYRFDGFEDIEIQQQQQQSSKRVQAKRFCSVLAKLDYEPEIGELRLTREEECEIFYKYHLRPIPDQEKSVIVARVDVMNHKILSLETVTNSIEKVHPLISSPSLFHPKCSEEILYRVIKRLEKVVCSTNQQQRHQQVNTISHLYIRKFRDREEISILRRISEKKGEDGNITPQKQIFTINSLINIPSSYDVGIVESVKYVPFVWKGPKHQIPYTFPFKK